jgi:hypothetical protein
MRFFTSALTAKSMLTLWPVACSNRRHSSITAGLEPLPLITLRSAAWAVNALPNNITAAHIRAVIRIGMAMSPRVEDLSASSAGLGFETCGFDAGDSADFVIV